MCRVLQGSECVEGCRCPDGQVFDETANSCVDIASCSCYHRWVCSQACMIVEI